MKCALTVAALVVCLGLVGDVVAAECPADSVQSGTVCMDKYRSKRVAGGAVGKGAD